MPDHLNTRRAQLPQLVIETRAAVRPSTVNEENRTVELVWTTGARGLRSTWLEDYYEELEVSTTAIRMDRLNGGAALLNNHRSSDLADQIGVVERAWIDKGEGRALVRFADDEDSDKIFRKVATGIIRNVSIRYAVHEYTMTEKIGEIPVYRATDWEPMEISLVTIPFDAKAQVRSADTTNEVVIIDRITDRAAGPETANEDKIMPKETQPNNPAEERAGGDNPTAPAQPTPAPAASTEEVRKAADDAVRAERERVSEIQTALRKAKLPVDDEFATAMIRDGVSVEKARAQIIDKWAERGDTVEGRNVVVTSAGTPESVRDAVGNALLNRSNPGAVKLTDDGRHFRGMTLLRIAEEILNIGGVNCRGMSKRELAARAMSTSDFVHILADVTNKTLRDGYESAPRTFAGIFRQTTAADFKNINRMQLSGAPSLVQVREDGEFKYGKYTDGKETYSLATYGRIVPITRQTIINDDLDAFTRIPQQYGRAAADLESDIVWSIPVDNAALSDGTALFHADHGNLAGSGGAISVTTLGAARAAMRVQTGLEGRLINVMPKFLVVGSDKETEAEQVLSSTYVPTAATGVMPERFRNQLDLAVEPRLTGNAWYLAAEFSQVDTIEYAYLEGENGPFTETREGFNIDGIEVKCRHDFAAKAIDHRGLYKNAGE